MKRQFLRLTALLLSGAMLLNVGCTDYDDDIRDIQNQIDNLTSVTIADLQTQLENAQSAISGINQTIEELQAADKANAALIAQLRQDMEKADADQAKALKDAIAYLEGLNKKTADAVDALGKSLDNLSSQVSALENTHKQDIDSVRNLYTSLSNALDAYKQAQALTDKAQDDKIKALDDRLTALDKTGGEIDQLKGRIKTLEEADLINRMTTVEGLLGADLANVLKEAGYSSVSAVIAEYVTVKADVDDLKLNFNAKVDAAIASASDEGNYYKISSVADLKAAVQSLHDGIEAANKKIAALQQDLASMIQSIVSVPEYTDGSFDMQVYTVDGAIVGNAVKLVYQITPAAVAETVVAAGIDAAELVVKEAKTRATAPSAQINSIKAGAEAGTIVVMATINNYPAGAAVNVALKFKHKVRSEEGSVLENDVISDYAGVIAVDAADYKAVTFEVDGTKEYKVAWNTPKSESLRTLFHDAGVVAKIDGVKYELSALKDIVGVEFGSVQYKVATTATPASGVFAVTNEAQSSFVNFPAKTVTVAFAKDIEYTNVGNKVDAVAQFRVKVGAAYANPVTLNATYTISNAQGATFVFGTLQKPWDYKWLMSAQTDLGGYYDLQPRPAIPAADLAGNQLGEVKVAVDGEGNTFQPSLFERIINSGVCVKNKVNGVDLPVKVSAKASEVALIALVSFDEATYEWGKTYNVEYVYTYENVDYTVKGTVSLGAAPANIKKEITIPMGWADATATVKLADMYAEQHPAGFADAAEFQSAVLQKGMDASNNGSNALLIMPTTTNYRYNAASKRYNAVINGTVTALTINPAIAVAPAATPATIGGKICRDAIEKDGDSFQQTWTMTTWYGQKIEVVATYNVVLPASSVFEMIAKDLYIKDGKVIAEGYIGTVGGDAVWVVETTNEIGNYFDWKKGNITDVDLFFKKLSVDNDRNSGTLGKYFANVNVNDTNNPKIEWTNNVTTEREVEVLAYVGLGARKINVAESRFTVVTPDPITTVEHSDLSTSYQINGEGDKSINVNLLDGMSIIDADRTPNQWIDNAQLATTKGTFSKVFATKPLGGYVYVNGVNFKITDNDQLEGVAIGADGHLTYVAVGGSTLQRDVNVKVEACIKYWLGEKTVNFTVTIRK
ncbi:MAG: hypothetical protein ACI35T_03410 [Alistipes sp.]